MTENRFDWKQKKIFDLKQEKADGFYKFDSFEQGWNHNAVQIDFKDSMVTAKASSTLRSSNSITYTVKNLNDDNNPIYIFDFLDTDKYQIGFLDREISIKKK